MLDVHVRERQRELRPSANRPRITRPIPPAAPVTIATFPPKSSVTVPPFVSKLQSGVEGVAQAVPEPVDRQHDGRDGEPWERGEPPGRPHERATLC